MRTLCETSAQRPCPAEQTWEATKNNTMSRQESAQCRWSGFLGFHKCIDSSGKNGRLDDIFFFIDCWFDDWQDTVGQESVADYPPVWLQMDCVLKSSWSHRDVIVPLNSGGGILDLPFADDMLLLGIFPLRTARAAFDTLVSIYSKSMSWHWFESECSPPKSVE